MIKFVHVTWISGKKVTLEPLRCALKPLTLAKPTVKPALPAMPAPPAS
jgi:hypothetical protein